MPTRVEESDGPVVVDGGDEDDNGANEGCGEYDVEELKGGDSLITTFPLSCGN